MNQGKRTLATSLLAAASLSTLAAPALHAQFVEGGTDAGQTLATARTVPGNAGTAVTSISGTIGTFADADLYLLTVPAGQSVTFTASTGSTTPIIDTSIFLFNSAGAALIANDDQSGISLLSSFSITLSPGNYYLGIALSQNEPVNTANQALFTPDSPTTAVRGPAAGVNPAALGSFAPGDIFVESGAYGISLSAVPVPEPSTYATLALGAAASLVFIRRIRRQQAA